jgi:putative SOS response-associated peptidase YedK
MITTEPNAFMKNIHNRMPVILNKKDGIDFLNAEPVTALKMCKSLSGEIEMKCDITSFKK